MPTKKANFFCTLAGDFFLEHFLRYSVGRASGVFLAENVLCKKRDTAVRYFSLFSYVSDLRINRRDALSEEIS